jgi:hypothetical protein
VDIVVVGSGLVCKLETRPLLACMYGVVNTLDVRTHALHDTTESWKHKKEGLFLHAVMVADPAPYTQ